MDYIAVSNKIRLKPGQFTANVRIPIKDDDIPLELNVTFSVTIIPTRDVIVLSNGTVTIVDNDHGEYIVSLLTICYAISSNKLFI